MEYEDFSKIARQLQDDIHKAIVQTMKENNITLISLYTNGSYSDFDVDKSYAATETLGSDIVSNEIIAVGLQNGILVILPLNAEISDESANTLEENVIFKTDNEEENSMALDLFDKEKYSFITIDETFTPTDTLLQLICTIEETIEIFCKKNH